MSNTSINKDDHIIEIGSGKGHFTKELVKQGCFVTAIEIDPKLSSTTKKMVKIYKNIEIINTDFLKYNFPQKYSYKIFGNIPFNLSTDIVKKIAFKSKAEYSYLLVEKGFAKRLQDAKRALGLLLMIELNVEVIKNIPRHYFHPKPSVDSVLIVMKRRKPVIKKKDYKKYNHFVYKWVNKEYRKLFTKKQFRQTLKHAKITGLNKITNEQFISLFNSYKLFTG